MILWRFLSVVFVLGFIERTQGKPAIPDDGARIFSLDTSNQSLIFAGCI